MSYFDNHYVIFLFLINYY